MGRPVSELQELLAHKREHLEAIPEVVGHAVGLDTQSNPCIKVYVRGTSPTLVDAVCKLFPDTLVEIEKMSDITAY